MKQYASYVNTHLTMPEDHLTIGQTVLKGPWYEVARVHFPLNRSGLDAQDIYRLKFLATRYGTVLSTPPPRLVEIVFIGTADPSGTAVDNQALSRRRAMHVSDRFGAELATVVEPWALVFMRLRSFGVGESWAAAADPADRRDPMAWRRVGIYANLPLTWIEAGIQRMKQQVRKAARQALSGHTKGIAALKKSVQAFEQQAQALSGSKLYMFPVVDLAFTRRRLEETEARFQELLAAIDKGTDAFMEWMNGRRRPFVEFLKTVVADLTKERDRIAAEAHKNPGNPEIQDLLYFMNDQIDQFNQDIEDYEKGRITMGTGT